jgi:hypothetical protein
LCLEYTGVALVQDTLDLADELGCDGSRWWSMTGVPGVAYGLAALAPKRVTSIAAPALDY